MRGNATPGPPVRRVGRAHTLESAGLGVGTPGMGSATAPAAGHTPCRHARRGPLPCGAFRAHGAGWLAYDAPAPGSFQHAAVERVHAHAAGAGALRAWPRAVGHLFRARLGRAAGLIERIRARSACRIHPFDGCFACRWRGFVSAVWNCEVGCWMDGALTVWWAGGLDAAAAHARIPFDEGSNCEPCATCDECDICMGPCLAVSVLQPAALLF